MICLVPNATQFIANERNEIQILYSKGYRKQYRRLNETNTSP
jgi:hypothetical protein